MNVLLTRLRTARERRRRAEPLRIVSPAWDDPPEPRALDGLIAWLCAAGLVLLLIF